MNTNADEWRRRRDWLPGPIHWLSLTSTDRSGGGVTTTGRTNGRTTDGRTRPQLMGTTG